MRVDELIFNAWDDFVSASPQVSAYAMSTFLRCMPCEVRLLRFDFSKGQQIGVIVANPDCENSCSPYPFTCYQGFFYSDEPENYIRRVSQLSEVLQFIDDNFRRVCFSLHPSIVDIRAIQWHNYGGNLRKFHVDVRYTGVLDLAAVREQGLRSLMSMNRIQELKKADKTSTIVVQSETVENFLRLYRQTFERQGLGVGESELMFIEKVVKTHLRTGKAKMYLALQNFIPVAGCVFLSDLNTAYYAFGAQDPDYRSSGGPTAVVAAAINDYAAEGYTQLDMVGVNSPSRGSFKLGFGAQPQAYFNACLV
jgi:hypothetical protein